MAANPRTSGPLRQSDGDLKFYINGTEVMEIADAAPYLTVPAGLTVTANGLTITAGGLTVTAGGISVTASDVTLDAAGAAFVATLGNVEIGTPGAFATTQPQGAVVMGGPSLGGIAPVGAIATAGAVFASDTVVRKIIANGTASNVET